jgi:hypothetical protein
MVNSQRWQSNHLAIPGEEFLQPRCRVAGDAGENVGQPGARINVVELGIVLVPEHGRLRVEVRGALAAILALSSAQNNKSPGVSAEAFGMQIKMVAGIRNHPDLLLTG